MMNYELFTNLLQNLLQVNVYDVTAQPDALEQIQESCCRNPILQPMYTKETLTYLAESMKEECFYEIVDDIGISLLFFSFADHKFFAGAYVKKTFDEKKVHGVLVENHIPASYLNTLRLYYDSLSILGTLHFQTEIFAVMRTFIPGTPEYTYRRLQGLRKDSHNATSQPREPYDYSEIYQRYDAENQFIHMISSGNVENVLDVMRRMESHGASQLQAKGNVIYSNPLSGFSMMRVMARKAAESGGLSVVTIDEITQRNVQQMGRTDSIPEMAAIFQNMIVELTQKVREQKTATGQYSEPIRKAMEYVTLNYSQQLSPVTIADFLHVSLSYLEKQFKKETGNTISYFIAAYRCSMAADLLKNTKQSVSDIAFYVGYSDNNYFVKVFKKYYDKTPGQYRKESLQNETITASSGV
jgi:AraC-like DNA-binding protein